MSRGSGAESKALKKVKERLGVETEIEAMAALTDIIRTGERPLITEEVGLLFGTSAETLRQWTQRKVDPFPAPINPWAKKNHRWSCGVLRPLVLGDELVDGETVDELAERRSAS